MKDVFQNLNVTELQALKDALALVTILIGKADNEFDEKELELAKKITHIRTYNSPEYLHDFYLSVEAEFNSTLDNLLNELPQDAALRNNEISTRLSSLNDILKKLDPKAGAQLYRGYTRLAQEVAKASGGFLGFLSVNSEEAKWIKLPMLTPIIADDDEEE